MGHFNVSSDFLFLIFQFLVSVFSIQIKRMQGQLL